MNWVWAILRDEVVWLAPTRDAGDARLRLSAPGAVPGARRGPKLTVPRVRAMIRKSSPPGLASAWFVDSVCVLHAVQDTSDSSNGNSLKKYISGPLIGMRAARQSAHPNRRGSLMYFLHTGTASNRQHMRLTTHHGLLVAWGQVAHWLELRRVLTDKFHIA